MSAADYNIGIGVTTHNRREIFDDTLSRIRKYSPDDVTIVIVDDGSDVPLPDADFRFNTAHGVAAAKNKCLELLDKYPIEHIFLFDDDTYPTEDEWWKPYVESPEHHLMYNFASGPSHWQSKIVGKDSAHNAWSAPRGCMLYAHYTVLPIVGGFHSDWGKHGGEHGDWSDRIHTAGLTKWNYPSPKISAIHCLDEDKPGISSVDSNKNTGWAQVDAEYLPPYAEYRSIETVPVLVPFRPDYGHRDRLWRFVQNAYWTKTDYKITIGPHFEGPFNRSAAINTASILSDNWSVAIVADSDTWVPQENLDEAISTALKSQKLVSCLTSVKEIDRNSTLDVLMDGIPDNPEDLKFEKIRTNQMETQSSMLVVPRNLWHRLNGFDVNFRGWGAEDNAFWKACELAAGKPIRIDGPAYHLWHPTSDPQARMHDKNYQQNQKRWSLYEKARTWEQVKSLCV